MLRWLDSTIDRGGTLWPGAGGGRLFADVARHDKHAATDAGSWSSLQRGSVVTGAVHGEEAKPVTMPPVASAVESASSADVPSTGRRLQLKEAAKPAERETRSYARRHGVERTVTAHASHKRSGNATQEAAPAVFIATVPVEAASNAPPSPPRVADEARDAEPSPPKPAQIEQPKATDTPPVARRRADRKRESRWKTNFVTLDRTARCRASAIRIRLVRAACWVRGTTNSVEKKALFLQRLFHRTQASAQPVIALKESLIFVQRPASALPITIVPPCARTISRAIVSPSPLPSSPMHGKTLRTHARARLAEYPDLRR